jgi:hypothetical protein
MVQVIAEKKNQLSRGFSKEFNKLSQAAIRQKLHFGYKIWRTTQSAIAQWGQ